MKNIIRFFYAPNRSIRCIVILFMATWVVLSFNVSACDKLYGMHVENIKINTELPQDYSSRKSGSILAAQSLVLSDYSMFKGASCGKMSILTEDGTLSGSETGRYIHQTSIPDVGMRIFYYNSEKGILEDGHALPFHRINIMPEGKELDSHKIHLRIELIKTSQGLHTDRGIRTIIQPDVLRLSLPGYNFIANLELNIKFPVAECHLEAPEVAIKLPDVTLSQIKRSYQTMKKLIPITLDCTGATYPVSFDIDGPPTDSTRTIFHSQDGVNNNALGVGVRFWYHGKVVKEGDQVIIPETSQKKDNSLYVGYVHDGGDIKPGNINVTATLHVNYL